MNRHTWKTLSSAWLICEISYLKKVVYSFGSEIFKYKTIYLYSSLTIQIPAWRQESNLHPRSARQLYWPLSFIQDVSTEPRGSTGLWNANIYGNHVGSPTTAEIEYLSTTQREKTGAVSFLVKPLMTLNPQPTAHPSRWANKSRHCYRTFHLGKQHCLLESHSFPS